MSKTTIMNNISRTFNKTVFKLKKHSPEILVAVGVVGTVTSTVMACKATTKVSKILEEKEESVTQIHKVANNPEAYNTEYTEEDVKKDLTIVYTQTAIKVIKLYAPSIILGTLSIGAIVQSHRILRKRNVALAAAYTAVDKSFKEYRGRLIERFGKDLDKELRFNIKAKEIEEIITNEDGSETIVKNTIDVMDPNGYSAYAKIYDDGCLGWTKDPESNFVFLKQQQNWANEKLKSKRHLFLNEVYDMLGIPNTKAGQIVGWIYDEKNPIGDNFVDFGIFDINSPKACDFVNGYERSIVLDFNVDGNIWELM